MKIGQVLSLLSSPFSNLLSIPIASRSVLKLCALLNHYSSIYVSHSPWLFTDFDFSITQCSLALFSLCYCYLGLLCRLTFQRIPIFCYVFSCFFLDSHTLFDFGSTL